MKVIIEVGHPAHVHLFRNAIRLFEDRGHRVKIVARDKDVTLCLLEQYGLQYESISIQKRGMMRLAMEVLQREWHLLRIAKEFQPDVFLSFSMCSAHVAGLLRKVSIIFDDTEHASLNRAGWLPFATVICTPSAYKIDLGPKQVRYDGYHELAYLHPTWFTPSPQVLAKAGLEETDTYFVVRFVSWEAAHDVRQHGFTREGKYRLVAELQKMGRVIITSESPLPPDLEPHRMPVSHAELHDLLAFSTLYIGEGGTLASEAVVLGVPAIFVNTLSMGYLEEQQNKYGMMLITADENVGIEQALAWGSDPNIKQKWQAKRQKLLADKVDVSVWMAGFVEQFLQSGNTSNAS